MIHDVPNPLYGCQHPFPNSSASVNLKLLSSIISPSFGPRTHELLPCGYRCRKVVRLLRNAKPEERRSWRVLNCPSEPATQLLWSDDVSAVSEANGTTVPLSLELRSSLSIQPSEGSRSRVRRTRGAMGIQSIFA